MAAVMPLVSVDGLEIDAATISAEMQNHPARDVETAWSAAAEALVIRQLLLDEAARLSLAPDDMHDPDGNLLTPEDAVIEALLEQEVNTPRADEDVCRRLYNQHPERFRSPDMVEAAHILFEASPDDSFACGLATGDARTAIRKLQADPGRFAELAKKHSACPSGESGGTLGPVKRGQMVRPFEDALFALAEDTLCTEPVITRFGVHIIRAGHRTEAVQLPFDSARAAISAHLEEASWRRAIAQYVAILAAKAQIDGVLLAGVDCA